MGRPPKPVHRREHGTENGYQQHSTHGTPYCKACRDAHRVYHNKMRAKRRRQRVVLENILAGGQTGTRKDRQKDITDEEFKLIMKTIKEDLDNA